MLQFLIVGALFPAFILLYSKRRQQSEGFYAKQCRNKALEEYLEADPETPEVDLYRKLASAGTQLLEQETELERENKWVTSLFHARLVSSRFWEDLKSAKEDLDFEKLTIEAELNRFKKLAGSVDIPRRQKKAPLQEALPPDSSGLRKQLEVRLLGK